MTFSRVLILGCGYAGRRVLDLAHSRGLPVAASVRSPERAPALRAAGASVLVAPRLGDELEPYLTADTRVVVAFPADSETDTWLAPRLTRAHSAFYVSSTGVYGALPSRRPSTSRRAASRST